MLQTRGLLVLRLPAPPNHIQEWFQWTLVPPDCEGATWYLDGSMLDGECVDYRAVGFGVVVIAPDGSLIGHGRGGPPCWCTTAAAAEAWALLFALRACPEPPYLKTDCQALLVTATEGVHKATAADKILARIWNGIAGALDGDVHRLVRDRLLTWLPAHQSSAAIGNRLLSNGREMSAADWRANRLVDALAKQAASIRQAPQAITSIIGSGRAASRHAAALLGQVTHAANHCQVSEELPDGTIVVKTRRDTAPRPRGGATNLNVPKPAGHEASIHLPLSSSSNLRVDCLPCTQDSAQPAAMRLLPVCCTDAG